MKTHLHELQVSAMPKSATEIIKEINMLELEVRQLEEYLLSLYRKAFDHHVALSFTKTKVEQKRDCPQMSQDQANDEVHREEDIEVEEQQGILDHSTIHRCHSSLSHHSTYSIQSPTAAGNATDAIHPYHSVPLTLLEHGSGKASESVITLGDHPGASNSGRVAETANWVSEEIVRCISAIYCQLSATPVISNDSSSPAISFESSMSGLAPQSKSSLWSPPPRINGLFDLRSDVPFHAVVYEELSGPCSKIIEVLQICRDSAKLREIKPMLQKFRSLVNRLEDVKPSKLKHEEKLAFWINIHNALVMHAYLVHGVPQNKTKRISLLLKAAYEIGDQTISVDMIQNFILGRRLPHPGQWFHRLLSPKKIFKTRAERKSFALDQPEPLSYFALSCGSHSDPPVRVYTPKGVFQDLIHARGEYILSNYTFHKEQNKIMLPKLMDVYAKDSGLHPADFMGIIEQILPANHQINRTSKGWKKKGNMGWIPHDVSFRCQLSKDLFE